MNREKGCAKRGMMKSGNGTGSVHNSYFSGNKIHLSLRSSNHLPTTVDTIILTAGFSSKVR